MSKFLMRKAPGNFRVVDDADTVRSLLENGSRADFFLIKEGPRSVSLKRVTQGAAKVVKVTTTKIMADGEEL